jgi:hypothetical protein
MVPSTPAGLLSGAVAAGAHHVARNAREVVHHAHVHEGAPYPQHRRHQAWLLAAARLQRHQPAAPAPFWGQNNSLFRARRFENNVEDSHGP